jgi:hypothetical protein
MHLVSPCDLTVRGYIGNDDGAAEPLPLHDADFLADLEDSARTKVGGRSKLEVKHGQ